MLVALAFPSWAATSRSRRRHGGVEGLVCLGVDLEGALELELLADLANRGQHVFAEVADAAHRVLVTHVAVAVPEEDVARPQRLEHVTHFWQHTVGRPDDCRMPVEHAVPDLVAAALVLLRGDLFVLPGVLVTTPLVGLASRDAARRSDAVVLDRRQVAALLA